MCQSFVEVTYQSLQSLESVNETFTLIMGKVSFSKYLVKAISSDQKKKKKKKTIDSDLKVNYMDMLHFKVGKVLLYY